MQVTKNITLDLLETGSPVIIKAKQNDRNTRYIAAHLYVDGLAYPVPSGTEIAFRYKKPDGTAGFYDTLTDNSPAITVSGNTVTVELVEQVLTAAGCVHCEINMYNAASEKLTTFTFEISVEESVLTDAEITSSDYYNVLTAEIAKALQAVTDATEQAENAAQSAQDAADSAAMSKDWAAGQPVTYSGTPVSIAYAGANRIDALTLYGENVQGGTTEAPVALTGITSVTVNDDVTELPIPRPLRRVGDVKDKCVTRQDYESAEKLVVTYNVGFVELDGTEDVVFDTYGNTQKRIRFDLDRNAIARYALKFSHGNPGDTPTVTGGISASFNRDVLNRLQIICSPDTWTALGVTDTATAKTWLAAQKAAGTPIQVAYQLATPETYATDPVDFDNAAGPLIIMTGGELEVRMTELIGSRSDVSNNTVAFTETAQDADIASGEKLSVLFGKIKKRFSVVNKLVNGAVYPNLGTNTNFPNPINQRGAASYTTTTEASIYCIDRWRILKNTTYTVASFTLTAPSYAARACGMWQSNEMGAHQLSIGDDVTVSIYANGKLHTPTMKVIDRDLYDAFANVPASYDCDDFEIVLCTYAGYNTMYNLGIYPKKPLTVNYIKWEKGSVATPYVPKAFGDEFLECLRYFVGGVGIGSAGIVSGSTFRVLIPTPVPMRTAPSVTVKVADNVVYNGTFKALNTTVSNITRQRNGIHLHIGMAASGVNNYPGIAYGLQCDLSADL